jgi:hypothetical protein
MSKASAENVTHILTNSSCPTATSIREQARFHSPGVFIPDTDISYAFLSNMLAKFKIEAIIDESGEIQVFEAFGPTIGIRLIPNRHWIFFHTGFETPTLSDEERTQFANYLSNNLAMAQFAATDGGIGMGFYMYYRGSLSVDQFMAMAQRFGSLACAAMRKYGTYEVETRQGSDEERTPGTLN